MNNHLYNLMIQATQEMKSLWRIEKNYINESQSDDEKAFWEAMKTDKQDHIEKLLALVKVELN